MKKILVIVDVQNDFVTGSLGSKEAEGIIPKVLDLIVKGDYDISYTTLDTHDANYAETHEGKMLPVRHCSYLTRGWLPEERVLEALEAIPRPNYVVTKSTFGSFTLLTKIDEFLDEAEDKDKDLCIDICGLCTDICVINNALMLRAAYPQADICVIADACAGTTPEMHQKALDVMKSCQVEVI